MNLPNRHPAVPLDARPPPSRLVLLADGCRAQRLRLRAQLERAGYRVVEAADGRRALDLCRDAEPDLILSDTALDGIGGLDLCRAHRGLQRRGYGFFILLTRGGDAAEVAAGLRAGADDFLRKPVTAPELLARIGSAERMLDMHTSLSSANGRLHAALGRLNDAQAQIEADLREARKLQQALIPERQRSFGAMRFSLLMRPAGLIGGDLVGFHRIDDATVGLHAVDVSGHGVASALMTARVAAQIEVLSREAGRSPSQTVAIMNELMLRGPSTDSYLTMVYGHLHLPSGRLRLVHAGHPHPLLQRADGRIEAVGGGGLPIGVVAGCRHDEVEIDLGPGDRLLIVSDGITDTADSAGAIMGEDGLRAIMQLNAPLSGVAFLESMNWSVSGFAGADRQDDASALLIEHLAPAAVLNAPGNRGATGPPPVR